MGFNSGFKGLNVEMITGDGKEFLCMFPLFETELSVTVDKTFAVKSEARV